MREYTLYCIGSDGDVEMRRDIYANDDLGALDQARTLSHDYDVEVWQGTHVVNYCCGNCFNVEPTTNGESDSGDTP